MKHSLVIYSQGLDIWRHTAGGIELESRIDVSDKSAKTKFQDWLTAERRRITLIADLADERHAFERLPHASRADCRQLIDRKLAQRFPEAAFTSAVDLPACQEDGLLKPMRLSAIPRSPPVALWLDVLAEAGMEGQIDAPRLTSVPFLIERWYRRQRAHPPQALLLTLGAGGMHQLFFRQRRLAFSRVILARAPTLAENLPTYRDELAQTMGWLPSQRIIEGSPPILVLTSEADFPLLRELSPPPGSVMDFIDLARCPNGGANALTLALRETQQGGALNHYDCPPLRRARQLVTLRHATWVVTAAILATGLANATAGFIDTAHLRQETGQFAAEQLKLQNELEKLNAETTTELGADYPDDWLDKAETLARDTGIAPLDILQAVAGLLDKAPWARLESLVWKTPPPPVQDRNENTLPLPNTPSVNIELEISITGFEPPQTAADRLLSLWQQQHGTPMKIHIDSGASQLRLDATLPLPAQEKAP